MTARASETDIGAAVALSCTLTRISDELRAAARGCTEIEWLVAALLDHAKGSDLPAELHMLQEVDRMQQTLADLSSLIADIAPSARGTAIPIAQFHDSLRLESLRARLTRELARPAEDDEPDITWL